MFGKKKLQQRLVRVSFIGIPVIPPVNIWINKGQRFVTDIGTDGLWEGNKLIREYDWVAGYTKVYEYLYEGEV